MELPIKFSKYDSMGLLEMQIHMPHSYLLNQNLWAQSPPTGVLTGSLCDS